jgi:hypothetical protein
MYIRKIASSVIPDIIEKKVAKRKALYKLDAGEFWINP